MSWLYSRVLVEEYLGDTSLDGEQSALSSGKPTQLAYCALDKMTAFSRLSQFGMTYAPLTASLGEELLKSYRAVFLAKTSVPLVQVTDLTEKDQECGQKWLASFVKYDPSMSSWKTHQCSFLGDLDEFSETWPQWGLMQDGECWELTLQDSITNDTESGLLPTVLATDWKGGTTAPRQDNGKLRFDQWRDYVKLKHGLTYPHPTHSEMRMGWPREWTDLKPLETDKCLYVRLRPGESFQETNDGNK
jgi:hypothetical protein